MSTDQEESQSIVRVGGIQHEQFHRKEHCSLFLPLFRRAFGDETTWGDKHALIMFAGRGREAEFFTPFCRHITMVDNHPACVDVLRRKFCAADRPYITVLQNNGEDVSAVPDGSVDILVAVIALMHIRPTRMRVRYATEFSRVPRGAAATCAVRAARLDAVGRRDQRRNRIPGGHRRDERGVSRRVGAASLVGAVPAAGLCAVRELRPKGRHDEELVVGGSVEAMNRGVSDAH